MTPATAFLFLALMGGWAACSEAGLLEDGGVVDRWITEQNADLEPPAPGQEAVLR